MAGEPIWQKQKINIPCTDTVVGAAERGIKYMKELCILGSTGSIGTQTLEVVAANPQEWRVRVLVAHHNVARMAQQIEAFRPDFAVLTDSTAAQKLQHLCPHTEILTGTDGLMAAATYGPVHTVLAAMVGYAGLRPTLAAIRSGKDVALANKETLVAAGHIVMAEAQKQGVHILPVDSEHSAIFQSLRAGHGNEVRRIILTASGGPFFGYTKEQLKKVTLEQCLRHPNWNMGSKVTIDSSTLANKGLEVMEAHWLFHVPYDAIEVVIHRQSIVHSLVGFSDGAMIAQLGLPDMRLPIQYALSYPDRYDCSFGELDLIKAGPLTFDAPDLEVFPALAIAMDCGREGGAMPCAFNAANEECVKAFVQGKIGYTDIPRILEKSLDAFTNISNPDLSIIEATHDRVSTMTRSMIEGL